MKMLGSCVKRLVLFCLLCQFAATGWAQNYPVKTVRLLVPFSPGSGSDTIGRIIAAGLTDVFGQQVIVDNRAGAAGNIGAEIAARAPADGYTLFEVNMGHAVNVSLYRNLPYDLLRDFAPVTQFASSPAVVVVHPSLPVKSVAELVKLAVTSARRLSLLPEYPTVAESGYPGYESGNWYGIMVPAKTPPETIAAIRSAAIAVLNNPNVSRRLNDLGYVPVGDQPEEFAAHLKSEIDKLGKILRQLGVTAG